MKQLLLLLPIIILSAGCSNNTPDVSGIAVEVKIARFDQFLFTGLDTNHIPEGVRQMKQQYPYFAADFLQYILGIQPLAVTGEPVQEPPGSALDGDSGTNRTITRFLQITRPLYDSISPKFKDVSDIEKDLKKAFQYVKYYFPAYKVPKVLTYIGPFDTPGVAVTSDAIAIGLHLFAGKDFPFYTSTEGQESYPLYISRRFERTYITPNCMKAVVEDMYPDQSAGKSLIEQMIEKGKRWYLVSKLLPDAPDSVITDYTGAQLKWTIANEGLIWNFMIQGSDIYTSDPAIVKNFVGEAPSTNGMPADAPGNIGQWVGWQIVKTYMEKHKDLAPDALMKLNAKTIYSDAKYKPK